MVVHYNIQYEASVIMPGVNKGCTYLGFGYSPILDQKWHHDAIVGEHDLFLIFLSDLPSPPVILKLDFYNSVQECKNWFIIRL